MAKPIPPLVEHCLELFAPLGLVRAKSMFGGWGFYLDEMFFALIADETLFLKVDGQTESAFQEAGSYPFTYTYKDGRSVTMAYLSAPEEAMESPAMMRDWGRLALGAALRAKAGKPARSAKSASAAKPAKSGKLAKPAQPVTSATPAAPKPAKTKAGG